MQRKIQEEILAAAEKLENGEISSLGIYNEDICIKINASKLIELKKQEDDHAIAIKKIEEKIRCFEEPVSEKINSENSVVSNVTKNVKNNEPTKIQQNYYKPPQTPIVTTTTNLTYYQTTQDQILNTDCSNTDLILTKNQQTIIQTDVLDLTHGSISGVSSPLPAYPSVIHERKFKLNFSKIIVYSSLLSQI